MENWIQTIVFRLEIDLVLHLYRVGRADGWIHAYAYELQQIFNHEII